MRDPIESLPTEHRLEPGVDVEGPAFVLVKDGHQATARVRVVPGVGLELRYLLDGSLRSSQVFKGWPELEAAANSKHAELLGLGWEDRR